MPRRGSNLPGFRETQIEFAAHIRNPESNPRPADIEPRRMQIYLDLFYNNIEGFLANGFPIAKQVLGHDAWHELAREFVHLHPSESPYFLEVSQEFLTFLGTLGSGRVADFLLELCHYEWVELALNVSDITVSDVTTPDEEIDPSGDLLGQRIVVSPLIWPLAYRYPVHEIGPRYQPDTPPEEPTHLVVYRRNDDKVKFLLANAVTLRLIELLGGVPLGASRNEADRITGERALTQICSELPTVESAVVYEKGVATLAQLRKAQILLGTIR